MRMAKGKTSGKKPAGFKGFGAVPEQLQNRVPENAATAPCGCYSGKMYAECCEPFHAGSAWPQEPLQLMRSRYSAYAYRLPAYIVDSTHKDNADWRSARSKWERELSGFCDGFEFVGLDVVGEEAGKTPDEHFIDFVARLRTRADTPADAPKGVKQTLRRVKLHGASDAASADFRERSKFVREDGRWLYLNGDVDFDPEVTMEKASPVAPPADGGPAPEDGAAEDASEPWAIKGMPRQVVQPKGMPSIRQAKQYGSGSSR